MKVCELLKIKNVWWKRLFQFILLCSLFIYNSSYAQDKIIRTGWYMGLSFGGGQIEYKNTNVRGSDHSFVFDIQGGIALQNSVIGLGFNDQIIKDDEKHQESEDISHLLCFLNLDMQIKSFYFAD